MRLKLKKGSGKTGRKTIDGARVMRRINVSIDVDTIEALKRIGNGQVSAGIRRAAAAYEDATRPARMIVPGRAT